MKTIDTMESQVIANITDKLNELKIYDTAGKTKRELAVMLVKAEAKDVDIECVSNKYF